MWDWALGLLITLLALAAVIGIVLNSRFRRTPEFQWRQAIIERHERVWCVQRALGNVLRELPNRLAATVQNLQEQALAEYLRTLPVSLLESYSGIGPVTISRIERAGYRSLADLQRNPNVNAAGLGEKRLTDIAAAVVSSVADAKSRFTSGGCPEGQEVSGRIATLHAMMADREQQLKSAIRANQQFIAELQPAVAVAQKATFWRYLTNRTKLVPTGWLNRPLPEFVEPDMRALADWPAAPTACKTPPRSRTTPAVAVSTIASPVDLFQQAIGPARGTAPVTQALDGPPPVRPLTPPCDDLELFVQFAFAVARADGRVARREKEAIIEHLTRRYGHDAALMNRAHAYCAHYESAAIDLERCLQALSIGRNREDCMDLYKFGAAIADASGPRNAREQAFLERVAFALNLPDTDTAPPAPLPEPSGAEPVAVPDHRTVLEIEATTPLSAELVRRQYNLLNDRYAPEKFAAAGAEFVQMAQGKRAALLAAAQALLAPLQEPLEIAPPPVQDLRHNPDLDAMFSVP